MFSVVVFIRWYFAVYQKYKQTDCNIKWNISQISWDKIYHLPSCPYYKNTTIILSEWEKRFCSEKQAQAEWRRKADNCN